MSWGCDALLESRAPSEKYLAVKRSFSDVQMRA